MMTSSANSELRLLHIFGRTARFTHKLDSYFQIYEEQLSGFIGKPITFVEVGVHHGGSLFMWRDYFGPQARIIGIDLNPEAKFLERDGFEIFIGDQAEPEFWRQFFDAVGSIDVLLDDGGHTNVQQVVTLDCAIEHVRDGGMILVEDVHTSYMQRFGNPSRRSFINFCKRQIDAINMRFHEMPDARGRARRFRDRVYCICFYDSMVVLRIDRRRSFRSSVVANSGAQTPAQSIHGGAHSPEIVSYLRAEAAERTVRRWFRVMKHIPFADSAARFAFTSLRHLAARWMAFKTRRILSPYFD